jgi:hypothetical protein
MSKMMTVKRLFVWIKMMHSKNINVKFNVMHNHNKITYKNSNVLSQEKDWAGIVGHFFIHLLHITQRNLQMNKNKVLLDFFLVLNLFTLVLIVKLISVNHFKKVVIVLFRSSNCEQPKIVKYMGL